MAFEIDQRILLPLWSSNMTIAYAVRCQSEPDPKKALEDVVETFKAIHTSYLELLAKSEDQNSEDSTVA
jgi:hypothetical protein